MSVPPCLIYRIVSTAAFVTDVLFSSDGALTALLNNTLARMKKPTTPSLQRLNRLQ